MFFIVCRNKLVEYFQENYLCCLIYILKPQDVDIWSMFYFFYFKVVQYFWTFGKPP